MTTKEEKMANASIRVLEILKRLALKPLSKDDIIKLIENNSSTKNIYSKETVTKYLHTFKLLGINVEKVNERFYLRTNLTKIRFTKKQLETLNFLKNYALGVHRKDGSIKITELFRLIENSFDEETIKEQAHLGGLRLGKRVSDSSAFMIRTFEEYCKDRRRLKLTLKDGRTYSIEPKDIIFKQEKAFLLGYNLQKREFKEFSLEDIENTARQPQRALDNNFLNPVMFRVKGALAKVYDLREGEQISQMHKPKKVILNYSEDRELLARRLLRYGKECEVLSPLEFRQSFIKLLDEMAAKYV